MESYGLEKLGITTPNVYRNLSPAVLVEKALERKEGVLTDTGALAVNTGKYTGRSPHDKFIVDTEGVHDLIDWGKVNVPTTRETFNAIKEELIKYLSAQDEVFIFDGFAGADPKYTRKFRIVNELASQNLFIHNLLIRPTEEELKNFGDADFTMLVAPGYKCDPEKFGIHSEAAIMIDYEAHFIIIAGSAYSGEIKKSVFSTMNFVLPVEDNVLPMHCSANMDPETGDTAVFFGLSGTGKTTLSADPARKLIGDDEHGWSDNGIFNFEGGCYAKCIDLKEENEPEIFHAIKFGAVTENVILDPDTRKPDYADRSLTENTRVGYPVEFISNSQIPGYGGIPKVVIFLTADSFGVLPPISKLDRNAAMYQFVTGFTAKVAGTERGITEPVPTFSTLFGQPFMPLGAEKYAQMLGERLDKYGTQVYLVNTGWSGGPYGTGSRMKLKYTRAMVTAALNGTLNDAEFVHDDRFNVDVPQSCPNVPSEVLNPRDTWSDKDAYDKQADRLAEMFVKNFAEKYPNMPKEIAEAGPKAK
ncbi:MAG: phosphoenolpyruvate carboxykinase (ATP) [Eubacterium sp.]|jgi:phosphoenolpyruvate carboxykinase (ATP)|nr:phosphoenolpyruvate carboxykinase (ATP) [Eubacterium sp.]MCH4047008.1 phosphoenolpyruvate carboxykinase (ATP) [Eubacterium sp.]MCH4080105.1 phosphoenolpyruvate carboxykinase (ATP) [Eubacterium sp.]MCH4109852.1 phosphoenolpyruvate carboxykinase (ATP) [Eubacterium sp.]MCI1306737.1 phosphoenolpyruvate carboxykinase (ATP) [Eubacterium sp.]